MTMVKKVDPDWTNFVIQENSVSSIRKYLELCQNWLVAPQEKNAIPEHVFCNKRIDMQENHKTYIGMYESDVRNCRIFRCTICKTESKMKENGKSLVSNPFTRAQFMLLCENCHHEISSFR